MVGFNAKWARFKAKRSRKKMQKNLYKYLTTAIRQAASEGATDVTYRIDSLSSNFKECKDYVIEKLEKKGFTVEWVLSGYVTIKWEE